MTAHAVSIPSWRDWLVRAFIYASIAGLFSLWSAPLALFLGLFMAINLIHHAADTMRRKSGYLPIPRHPSMPGAPKEPLRATGRALGLIFAITWGIVTIVGRVLTESSWPDAALQALVFTGFATMAAAVMFPLAVIALLWTLSVTLGLILSLADIAAILLTTPDKRKAWHRKVDQTDHGLADLVLGQQAMIPLRADLAERAAEEARDAGKHA